MVLLSMKLNLRNSKLNLQRCLLMMIILILLMIYVICVTLLAQRKIKILHGVVFMTSAELITLVSSATSSPIFKRILNWILQRLKRNKVFTDMINKFLILLSLKLDDIQGVTLTPVQFSEIASCIKDGNFKNSEYVFKLYCDVLVKLQLQIQYLPELRIFIDLLLDLTDLKKIKLYREQILQLFTLITIIKEKTND